MKRAYKAIITLVLVVLLVSFARSIDFEAFARALNLPFKIVATLVILQLVTVLIIGHQWYVLIKKNQFNASFSKIIEITMMATLIESITPSVKAGGEGVRAFMFNNDLDIPFRKTTSIIFMQKSLSLATFIVFFLASLPHVRYYQFELTIKPVLVIMSALVVIVVGYFIIKLINKFKLFISDVIKTTKKMYKYNIVTYLVSSNIIMWLLYPIKVSLLVYYFSLPLSFSQIAIVTFISYGASMLPTTPGSVGTFEGVMILGFLSMGVELEVATVIALATRFFTFYLVVIVSVIYTLAKKLSNYYLVMGGA
jgi:hypothetical protein